MRTPYPSNDSIERRSSDRQTSCSDQAIRPVGAPSVKAEKMSQSGVRGWLPPLLGGSPASYRSLSGPKCPRECPRERLRKQGHRGCLTECPTGCLRGPKECPKSVPRVSRPQKDTPCDTESDTPCFCGHSRGHSPGHFGPKRPERLL